MLVIVERDGATKSDPIGYGNVAHKRAVARPRGHRDRDRVVVADKGEGRGDVHLPATLDRQRPRRHWDEHMHRYILEAAKHHS